MTDNLEGKWCVYGGSLNWWGWAKITKDYGPAVDLAFSQHSGDGFALWDKNYLELCDSLLDAVKKMHSIDRVRRLSWYVDRAMGDWPGEISVEEWEKTRQQEKVR